MLWEWGPNVFSFPLSQHLGSETELLLGLRSYAGVACINEEKTTLSIKVQVRCPQAQVILHHNLTPDKCVLLPLMISAPLILFISSASVVCGLCPGASCCFSRLPLADLSYSLSPNQTLQPCCYCCSPRCECLEVTLWHSPQHLMHCLGSSLTQTKLWYNCVKWTATQICISFLPNDFLCFMSKSTFNFHKLCYVEPWNHAFICIVHTLLNHLLCLRHCVC